MAAGIFISYRRQDSIAHARAVYERLGKEFGSDGVFMDLEGVEIGEDFIDLLNRQLAHCLVMLVLIGPMWLNATDARGRRRLDQASDFVRLEVGTALARRGVRVVPLLMDDTVLPGEDELPEDLRPLLRRQALSFRFAQFDADARHLVAGLRRALTKAGDGAALPAARTTGASQAQPAAPAVQKPAVQSARPVPSAEPRRMIAVQMPWAFRDDTYPGRPAWASDQGDDGFGRWAEFTVQRVVQRLRWIPPGEFLMGSPDDECERHKNEGPQHRVRLSQGFWLADTACTQALWRAVMDGKNPAHFQDDPNNPVERVSHDEALQFLARLRDRLGNDAEPVLPTEAQWEYACRAGTKAAFSFGAKISTEQVNYNGNFPYDGAAEGPYRERTVPVKSLPPNPAGLYEVHGNVWEWCADGGKRPYPDAPVGQVVEDPFQPALQGPEAPRALRGGSWFVYARYVRSAYRFADPRGSRDRFIGFRLALRCPA